MATSLSEYDGRSRLACTEEPPEVIRDAIARGIPFVAHNADSFDAEAWRLLVGGPQPAWIDTIHGCRAAGLPAGLDAAGKALGGSGKDEQGGRIMKLLCTAKQTAVGNVVYPAATEKAWLQMLVYNIRDVLELQRVYNAVGDPEPELLAVHRKINSVGIPIDIALARRLQDLWTKVRETARDEVAELTGGLLRHKDLDSPQKVKHWLARKGLKIDSLSRARLEVLIADPEELFGDADHPDAALIEAVLRCRQSAIRTAPAKLERALGSRDGDRVKNAFVYHGAGPGRWSGRDLQPHNFPRGAAGVDVEHLLELRDDLTIEEVEREASLSSSSVGDVLATLMRPIITAPDGKMLVICDYASVEARCVAWLSRDDKMLEAFASRDIYCEMASKIFGEAVTKREKERRQLGKIVVLGCGYQMGAAKFALTAKLGGTDLAKAGVTAEQCVSAFRSEYSSVPMGWRALNDAFIQAIGGLESTACRCTIRRVGDDVHIILPSGRHLIYRDARMEMVSPAWGGAPKLSATYASGRGYRKALYGGILMENVSQGTCRDLLASSMVHLDRLGLTIPLHVHDELVCECDSLTAPDVLHTMLEVMSTPPTWAAGFPLEVEGFSSKHYVKSPLSGSVEAKAKLGVVGDFHRVERKQDSRTPDAAATRWGKMRANPDEIAPDAFVEWPYWAEGEPETREHEEALLARMESVEDVYDVAKRYGIAANELRIHAKEDDSYYLASKRLFDFVWDRVGMSPTNRIFRESDYSHPLLHWDELVSHLMVSNDVYTEIFPFRDLESADRTTKQDEASRWLWDFYTAGEPRREGRKEVLERTLRRLLDRRWELKHETVPF